MVMESELEACVAHNLSRAFRHPSYFGDTAMEIDIAFAERLRAIAINHGAGFPDECRHAEYLTTAEKVRLSEPELREFEIVRIVCDYWARVAAKLMLSPTIWRVTPIETRGPFQHRTPVPIRDAAVTMFECSLSYEHLMGNVKDYLVSRIADLLADPIRFGSTALHVDRAVTENARMLTAAGWKDSHTLGPPGYENIDREKSRQLSGWISLVHPEFSEVDLIREVCTVWRTLCQLDGLPEGVWHGTTCIRQRPYVHESPIPVQLFPDPPGLFEF